MQTTDLVIRTLGVYTESVRLDFGEVEDELLQLDANKRYGAKRLEEIREELKTEPPRIEHSIPMNR